MAVTAYRPEIWMDEYVMYTQSAPGQIQNLAVTNLSSLFAGSPRKGDHVEVPAFTLPAPIGIAEGTATFSSLTSISKTLTVNLEMGHAVAWGNSDDLLNAPDQVSAIIREAAYRQAIRKNLEIIGNATGSDVGATLSGSSLTAARMASARRLLDDSDVPLEDRFAVIPSLAYTDLLGVTNFTSADFGAGQNQNQVTLVHGIGVIARPKSEFVLTVGSGTDCYNAPVFQRKALGYAEVLKQPRVVPVGGAFRDAIEVMSIFGTIRLRPAHMVNILTAG